MLVLSRSVPLGAAYSCHTSTTTGSKVCTGDASFSQIQSVLNQLAQMKGLGSISVDGQIGNDTVELFASVTGESLSAEDIASNATFYLAALQYLLAHPTVPTSEATAAATEQTGMTPSQTNWMLWGGVTLGAVLLVGGFYMAIKTGQMKKPKFMSRSKDREYFRRTAVI